MRFFRFLLYDLRQGFHYNRLKYAVAAAASACTLIWLGLSLNMGYQNGFIQDTLSFTDVAVYLLRGTPPYDPGNGQYVLPVIWLLLQTLLFFITAYYPRQDIYQFGQQIFLRAYKKTSWWYSKCIWCATSVAAFYLMIFGVAVVGCFCLRGTFAPVFSEELASYCYGGIFSEVTFGQLWVLLAGLPFAVSLGMCLFQMMLSFFVEPVVSYLIVIGIMAASTYVTSPWLIGNYSMVLRSAWIRPDGVDTAMGFCLAVGVGIFSIIAGAQRMKKYDILAKG